MALARSGQPEPESGFLAWWLGELRGLLPRRWREAGPRRHGLLLQLERPFARVYERRGRRLESVGSLVVPDDGTESRAAAAGAAPAPRADPPPGRHAPGARRGRRAHLHRPPAGRGRGRPRPDHGPQARSADPLVGRAGLCGAQGPGPAPGRHARGAGRRRVPPAARRAAARPGGAGRAAVGGRRGAGGRRAAHGRGRPAAQQCPGAARPPVARRSCCVTLLLAVAGIVGLLGWQIYQRQHLLAEQTQLADGARAASGRPARAAGEDRRACGRRPASSPTTAAAGRRRSWCWRC